MAAPAELLKRVPLFADLDRNELKSVVNSLNERTFKAGETVLSEGKGGVGFFVIGDGEAEVSIGGEPRGTLRAGDHFGEIALIAKSPRTATITATSDLTCYGMSSWSFRPLVEANGSIAWKLLQAMATRYASP
jgi:CRP-like cAMP-binding protein